MATINTSWTTVDSYTWTASSGFSITFYLDARYSASDKQSIENNGSNIYTRLRSVINQGSGSGSGYSFNCSFCETISGSSVWYLATETILESAKTFVEHETDGTKKITLTAGGSINYIGLSFSLSADVVLDTIPRTTKLSAQTATIGTALKITWTKASSAFTHELTYTFGDSTDVVIGTDLVDSVTWTPSTSLYKEIPDDPSGKGTLTLTTYNGTTVVGSSTADLTIYAKESVCRPKISSGSVVDTNSTTINLTGDSSVIVIGQSVGKLSLKFVTQYYATAKTLKVNNVSQSFTLSTSSSGTYTYTATITYNNVKTNSFKVEVTDSRAFTNSSYTVTAKNKVDYIPLSANVKFKRIQPTTGEVGVTFNGDYFNQSFGSVSNTLAITYKYKVRNSDTYSDIKTFTLNTDYVISENTYYSGTSSSESVIKLSDTFDYKSSFEGIMYIEDQLQVLAVNFTVVKGIPIFWWNGEKVTVNGELYVANEDGENVLNVKEKINNLNESMTDIDDALNNLFNGTTRQVTVADSYVKLFTLNFPNVYKSCSIWFALSNTQGTGYNALCNLYVHKGSSTTELGIRNFKYMNIQGYVGSRLIAVVTDTNVIEVYYQMRTSDSPTINILSMSKLDTDDGYGKVTLDMSTVVSSLPSGTQKIASSEIPATEILYSGGTLGTVTLSESANNFDYIEIFYNKGSYWNSTKVPKAGYDSVCLLLGYATSDMAQIGVKNVKISGTSIYNINYGGLNGSSSSANSFYANEISIALVIGYRA